MKDTEQYFPVTVYYAEYYSTLGKWRIEMLIGKADTTDDFLQVIDDLIETYDVKACSVWRYQVVFHLASKTPQGDGLKLEPAENSAKKQQNKANILRS